MPRISDREALPPWWRRSLGGMGIGAAALGGPWLLILLMLVFGGRFQRTRGSEWDMLLLAVVYPLGPAIAGALLGLVMPLLRRPRAAVIAGILAGIPWFATVSLAVNPRGAKPYSIDWPIVLIMAVCLGPVAGAFAHDLIPVMRKRRQRSLKRASNALRAVVGIASIPFAAGVAMSQSPTPSRSHPMNDTPVTLPSGTVVRVRNIVVFVGPSGKSLTLYIQTPTRAADSAVVARDAKELIDLHGGSATLGPLVQATVAVCRTQACVEMREAPSEMFFFLRQPDGSWRATAPPDR